MFFRYVGEAEEADKKKVNSGGDNTPWSFDLDISEIPWQPAYNDHDPDDQALELLLPPPLTPAPPAAPVAVPPTVPRPLIPQPMDQTTMGHQGGQTWQGPVVSTQTSTPAQPLPIMAPLGLPPPQAAIPKSTGKPPSEAVVLAPSTGGGPPPPAAPGIFNSPAMRPHMPSRGSAAATIIPTSLIGPSSSSTSPWTAQIPFDTATMGDVPMTPSTPTVTPQVQP